MKNLKHFGLMILAFSLLFAIPAAAQNGKKGQRNNNGANEPHGQARAEEVQTENKKGDKDPTPSKGSKAKRKHEGWEKKGKHLGRH
jgi:hypothetical protein